MKSITDPTSPLWSVRARGRWQDDFIFYVLRGKQVIRAASSYDKSPKPCLSPFQAKFRAAVAAWQALPPGEKLLWNSSSEAKKRRLPGYNVFISAWLRA